MSGFGGNMELSTIFIPVVSTIQIMMESGILMGLSKNWII